MRYALVIALVCACKDKAAPAHETAASPATGSATGRGVACGPLTCPGYCVVTSTSSGSDVTYRCADTAPVRGSDFACGAPGGGEVDCIRFDQRADAAAPSGPPRAFQCGPRWCLDTEYCITTEVTGGARGAAERGRAPRYRCDAKLPDASAGECQPPQGRMVACVVEAK